MTITTTYFVEFFEGLDRGCFGMRHVGTRSLRSTTLDAAKTEARELLNRCPGEVASAAIYLVELRGGVTENAKYIESLQREPYIPPRPGHGRLDVAVGRSFGGEWPGPSK